MAFYWDDQNSKLLPVIGSKSEYGNPELSTIFLTFFPQVLAGAQSCYREKI